jgi:hypothetical protein
VLHSFDISNTHFICFAYIQSYFRIFYAWRRPSLSCFDFPAPSLKRFRAFYTSRLLHLIVKELLLIMPQRHYPLYSTRLLSLPAFSSRFLRLSNTVTSPLLSSPFFSFLLLAPSPSPSSSWSQSGSNRRPPACKAGALPAELWPLTVWWAWIDLNYRPHAYQACALTN